MILIVLRTTKEFLTLRVGIYTTLFIIALRDTGRVKFTYMHNTVTLCMRTVLGRMYGTFPVYCMYLHLHINKNIGTTVLSVPGS